MDENENDVVAEVTLREQIAQAEELAAELGRKSLDAIEGRSGRLDIAQCYATLAMAAEIRLSGLRQKLYFDTEIAS